MKKALAGLLVLLSVVSAGGIPANAATCLCVGYASTQTCGNGGVGGHFLKVSTVSSNLLQHYLTTVALQAQLSASGKAYDNKTGWFCWNGTLQ